MSILSTLINILYQISQFMMPIFIFILVFNTGMSESPKTIFLTLKREWTYFLRLVVYNNIILPVAVWLVLQFIPLDPSYANAFIVLFLASGAPILIMFVQLTGEEIKYAVSSVLLLIFSTIVIVPILLPLLIVGAEITPMDLVSNMIFSILLPLILGVIFRMMAEDTAQKIGPHVQTAQKVTMNIAIYGMLPQLFPQLVDLFGSGVILTGFALIGLVFGGGYFMGMKSGNKVKQWTASFSAGQRNGAIAFSIVLNNFADPDLFVATAVITSIATVLFVQGAKYIGNKQTETAQLKE